MKLMLKISAAVLLGVMILSVWMVRDLMRSDPVVRWGQGVPSHPLFPATASDIHYLERGGFGWVVVAEATLEPADFEAFAREKGWQPEAARISSLPGRQLLEEEPVLLQPVEIGEEGLAVLFHERRAKNGGGETVVYDPARRRLLLNMSHR